tara:strand:+ start:2775 stop:3551 length:777 start_codon:yes stop_codon:yes gene_type:complete
LININIRTKDLKNLNKLTKKYSEKSLRRVVYKTADDAGAAVAGGKGKPDGLIAKEYEDRFNNPVPFTLSSVYYSTSKNTITFHTFNEDGKGTSPARYLFPVIGGGGAEIPLKFDKWVWNRNYAFGLQWPKANMANKEFIKKRNGHVIPQVYRDTQMGLNKTRNERPHRKIDGPRIQDGRVFSKTNPWVGSSGKVYKAGIYRVKTNLNDNYVSPLFFYESQDAIPQAGRYEQIFSNTVRNYILDEDRVKKNIEKYAVKN